MFFCKIVFFRKRPQYGMEGCAMAPENFSEPVQEETARAKNFFARLGGVFSSPREAFTEIGRAPRLIIPIIALLLITAFGGWYMAQKIDTRAAARAALERAVRQGQITEAQMNQQLTMTAAIAGPALVIGSSVSVLIICLAIAGYGKLFSMVAGAENSFKSLLTVSIYAVFAVSVVSTVLMILILQIRGQGRIEAADAGSIVASSLGSWIESTLGADALPKFVLNLAKAVDIFNIWIIALLSVGFSAVSKKLKTSAAATWLCGAYLICYIINAAFRAVFSS
jgi:hypothetical protein